MRPLVFILHIALLAGCRPPAASKDVTSDRVAAARKAHGRLIRERVENAGLSYPPLGILLRAFKHEAEVEVWARGTDDVFKKIATFAVTKSSGGPGPKRREGDRQVPEGFYAVNVFNPKSNFHLSLGLNYPNESDRILADPKRPGSEIFIHGGAASVGCLPVGDGAMEELYLLALDAREQERAEITVHIFPARMSGEAWESFAAHRPDLRAFWANLQPGYDAFESGKRLPRFTVDAGGRYVFGR